MSFKARQTKEVGGICTDPETAEPLLQIISHVEVNAIGTWRDRWAHKRLQPGYHGNCPHGVGGDLSCRAHRCLGAVLVPCHKHFHPWVLLLTESKVTAAESVTQCASYFSCCCDNIPHKSNSRKEEFILSHSLWVHPSWWGRREVSSHHVGPGTWILVLCKNNKCP